MAESFMQYLGRQSADSAATLTEIMAKYVAIHADELTYAEFCTAIEHAAPALARSPTLYDQTRHRMLGNVYYRGCWLSILETRVEKARLDLAKSQSKYIATWEKHNAPAPMQPRVQTGVRVVQKPATSKPLDFDTICDLGALCHLREWLREHEDELTHNHLTIAAANDANKILAHLLGNYDIEFDWYEFVYNLIEPLFESKPVPTSSLKPHLWVCASTSTVLAVLYSNKCAGLGFKLKRIKISDSTIWCDDKQITIPTSPSGSEVVLAKYA